jgi:hypothetical protein
VAEEFLVAAVSDCDEVPQSLSPSVMAYAWPSRSQSELP